MIKDVERVERESAPREKRTPPVRSFKALMEEEEPLEGAPCITPFELMSQTSVKPIATVDAAGVIDEVFHVLCEKMVYMESNGIEQIEVHYCAQSEASPLLEVTFTIERYDTAPSEWNITFQASPEGVELLTPEIPQLEMRLRGQFENQAIRMYAPELLQKERFGKRTTLLSSEKTQDRKWRRIQAAGSATSHH